MPSFQSIGAGLLAVLLFACQSPAGSSPAAQVPPAVPVPTVPTHPYFAGSRDSRHRVARLLGRQRRLDRP